MHTELLQNWMNSKRCYVTGANGALGSEICVALLLMNGIDVVALRRDENNSYFPDLELHSQAKNNAPKFLIHCGWDTSDRTLAAQSNSKSETVKLAQYCREQEIKFIFISSQSATLGTRSHYGEMKFVAEQLVAEHGGLSLRPGLILFNPPAGIQKKLCAFSKYGIRIKFFPNMTVSVIAVRDLVGYLMSILNEGAFSTSNAKVTNRLVPINSLTDLSRHRFGVVIPIPLRLLNSIVRCLGLFCSRAQAIDDSLSAILD